jgi:putative acetyltransferase
MNIQTYSPERAAEIADLYHAAVHAIADAVYTPEQKEAWAPTPPDYGRWAKRLNSKRPFLALIDKRIAGFIELEDDGHIDCLYTHPNYQGRGVASALYDYLLDEASNRRISRLFVEASHVAKPFFAKRGFAVVRENLVERQGVALSNFSMEKWL